MKNLVPLAAFVVSAVSQSPFEPADFNITEVLLENGVDVSALPQLATLRKGSSTSSCAAAVSQT